VPSGRPRVVAAGGPGSAPWSPGSWSSTSRSRWSGSRPTCTVRL